MGTNALCCVEGKGVKLRKEATFPVGVVGAQARGRPWQVRCCEAVSPGRVRPRNPGDPDRQSNAPPTPAPCRDAHFLIAWEASWGGESCGGRGAQGAMFPDGLDGQTQKPVDAGLPASSTCWGTESLNRGVLASTGPGPGDEGFE